jgi:ubiquinone/menaquinone biosynthesis C-methylase UbiE
LKIILRKIKRLFDWLLGDLSDQIFWKYIHFLRKDWKDGYLDHNCLKQGHRKFLINLITKNKKVKKILELGCGDGINLRKIAQKNCFLELVGIDINKFVIDIGKSKIKNQNHNIKLIRGNFKNLKKFKDNHFDIVFSDAALMYIDNNNIYKVLKEVLRISGSKIFICEQHTDGLSYYDDRWIHNYKLIFNKISNNNFLKIHNISNTDRSGDWAKFGKIIEVSKEKLL